jgi:hypothetical protein
MMGELEELRLSDEVRRNSPEPPDFSIRASFSKSTASSPFESNPDGEQQRQQWRQWKPQGLQVTSLLPMPWWATWA